jgi:hypothetical protein
MYPIHNSRMECIYVNGTRAEDVLMKYMVYFSGSLRSF